MTNSQTISSMPTRIERINPSLYVRDLSASLCFYIDMLGFALYVETPNLAIIQRSGHQIHLVATGTTPTPALIWIGVQDIQPLYDRFKSKNIQIVEPPTNYPWAYQMKILDPDGNTLTFGSGPRKDIPIHDQ